jgi:thiosulfate dehydrogenase
MKYFVLGLLVGLLILPLLGAFYVMTGRLPVAATDHSLPYERKIAHRALNARIHREAPDRDVSGLSTADLVAGAEIYNKDCAFCHGLPQQPASPEGRGMFPHAPQLFIHGGVTDDPAGETYWKVDNGIRLSGMPSFHAALTDARNFARAESNRHSQDKISRGLASPATRTRNQRGSGGRERSPVRGPCYSRDY